MMFYIIKSVRGLLVIITLIFVEPIYGQGFVVDLGGEIPSEDDSIFYASVIDQVYGVEMYENLNHALGGDSTRYGYKKKLMRGWYEDYYPNAQLLHRGYYVDGHLKMYKNFYPNGQLERSFKSQDNVRSTVEKYYQDGAAKSNVVFKNGQSFKWEDYYPNGKMEYYEEYNKNLDYYVMKQTYYKSGQLQSQLELIKPSKKLYDKKEYYLDGKIKEEGQMGFSENLWDYLKIGKWLTYDESGKPLKEEIYINGKLNKEKSF
ncbi:MAG: hypothetical protein COB85_06410 [Bacteroidetes bacterium]|nr:MAG: hypothetical protein COB85_06410 [Bacteroidota bacterium]